jgi:ABC-type uncharacterized transport system permease subunit
MPLIAAAVACLFYAVAAVLLGRRMLRGAEAATVSSRASLALALAGVLLHGYLVLATTMVDGGLRLGLFNAGSLAAWAVALLLVVAAWRMPVENLGIAIFPIAGLFALASALAPGGGTVISGSSRGLDLHIVSSILAYSLLTIAAFQAVLLAVQDRHLHNRQPGGIIRALPPAQRPGVPRGPVRPAPDPQDGAVDRCLGRVRGAVVGALEARLARTRGDPLDAGRLRHADARLLW